MKELSFYPWDHGKKPYYVNEEGFEWYLDKFTTDHALKDDYLTGGHEHNKRRGLRNVAAFFVRRGTEIRSVLINAKQDIVVEAENSIALWNKIDILKISQQFNCDNFADEEKAEEREHYLRQIRDFLE